MRRSTGGLLAVLAVGVALAELGTAASSPARAAAGLAGTAQGPRGRLPAAIGLKAAAGAKAASVVAAGGGGQLWVRRYDGPASSNDRVFAMAVSLADGTVFVTGQSFRARSGNDYATVAYNPATGAQLWVQRYNGRANRSDDPSAVAIGPDGTVSVSGSSTGTSSQADYTTIAYRGS